LAEMVTQSLNGSQRTRFVAVRFGNVIGSSGSVIPLFQKQLARGGPLTVTHPEVTRYFMSIPEAAQLILQAGTMGEGGEIFILDMGKPIKIVELARDLIRLHGLEPDRDIVIEFIGLRPGEKLYEELITEGEGIVATAHKKIMVLRGTSVKWAALMQSIEQLSHVSRLNDSDAIRKKLCDIVPEYKPSS
ncbi:MAG TPA: polysaccharide biosynthesis protein, partial [Syntrophales bacterium]|nr:polysaccharide biosynthesis protein [Syntrophales bacterium]